MRPTPRPASDRDSPLGDALRIGGIYLAVSALWIYLSDAAVTRLLDDPATIRTVQTVKGWGFVLASAALIVFLVQRELDRVHASAARFRALLEQNLVPVYVIRRGRFLYANPALAAVFGYEPREMEESVTVADVVDEEDRDRVLGNLALREAGRSDALHYRFRGLRRDGTGIGVEVHGARVAWEDEPAVLGVLLDVSERERLQRRLFESQKMETLGRLTGEVAHDFNNLLTAIIGPLDLCVERLPEGGEARTEVEEARAAASRAAQLSRKLLTFSRRRPAVPKRVDVADAIEELEPVLRRLVGDGVTLRTEMEEGSAGAIDIEPSRLEQVILNLVTNASQALGAEGEVVIRSGTTRRGNGEAAPYVWIEVEDDGPGIDPGVADQVFEPFFTTKETGTGLGLSTVYGIVKQAGGDVELDSEIGAGTRFRLLFPRSSREPRGRTENAVSRAEIPASGAGTILVVEDETPVREVVVRALERFGYSAIPVPDGASALRALAREGDAVDLLLVDVQLPDALGTDLARAAAADHPALPVLYTSGYSNEEVVHELADAEGVHLLEKPFRVEELIVAVRERIEDGRNDGAPGDDEAIRT